MERPLVSTQKLIEEINLELTDGLSLKQDEFLLYSYNAIRELEDFDLVKQFEISVKAESLYYNLSVFSIPKNILKILSIKKESNIELIKTNNFNNILSNEYYRNGDKLYVSENIKTIIYNAISLIFCENGFPMIKESTEYEQYIKNYILWKIYANAEKRNMVRSGISKEYRADYLWNKAVIQNELIFNELKTENTFNKINLFYGPA